MGFGAVANPYPFKAKKNHRIPWKKFTFWKELVAEKVIVGDALLIAHNGHRFDMPFLHQSCLRHGLPLRPVPFVDSMAFSRKLWGGRGGHGLDNVIARLGVSTANIRRHDARSDVHLLAQAVGRMWEQLTPDRLTCPVPVRQGLLCLAGPPVVPFQVTE